MTTHEPVTILSNTRSDPHDETEYVLEQAAAMSSRIVIVKEQDIKEDPTLLEKVDIVYGWLASEKWPLAKNLKWFQADGAGLDPLLFTPEVKAHPAAITNTHAGATAISEHLFGMLLMLTRSLHTAYRQQLEHRWDREPCKGGLFVVSGKMLGVVGVGAVGRRAAKIGAGFGMRVIGLDRDKTGVPYVEVTYSPERKHEMLAECDYIMVALPLTPETRGFISRPEFEIMKPGALLFNTGRGGTIDTKALVEALRRGTLAGAGIDTPDPEPLPPDHPLWAMPNVIITPHNAGGDPSYWAKSGKDFLENLRRYLAGEPLRNVVDRDRGY